MKLTRELFVGWLHRLPQNTRSLVLTCVYGLAGGLIAVAFQSGINFVYQHGIVALSGCSAVVFLSGTLAVILATSLVAGWLLNSFCPQAAGSGIPQVKLAFWKDFGVIPLRVLWVKYIAGVLQIGGGSSLGREGPTVHLAAALTSNLSGPLGVPKQSRRLPAAAGSAAGLAAAFNAPLASITFVLEEIIEDLNSRILGSVILASVLGAFVVYALIGKHPAFEMGQVESPAWQVYLCVPVVAAFAALAGVIFQRATLVIREKAKRLAAIPRWAQPMLGGLITWLLGAGVFLWTGHLGVFSLGYEDLSAALNDQMAWKVAGVLLVAKLAATCASYGWGGCGGIFAPSLFLGGMAGALLAGVFNCVLPLGKDDRVLLAVVGMSACLGAVVRAPITSILIVFEMTHQFALVPALLLGCLVSQAVARTLLQQDFYGAILQQDGQPIRHVMPPRDLRGWETYPVSAIANFRPMVLTELDPARLRSALEQHGYGRFPVSVPGKPVGIVTRQNVQGALDKGIAPEIHPVPCCLRDQSIGEVQRFLIEAEDGMVAVLDQPGGAVIGLLTLHDLLRGQIALAKQLEE